MRYKAMLEQFYNFNEVAANTLSLLQMMIGTRTFFVGYTDSEEFSILKVLKQNGGCLLDEGVTLSIEHSY